jgi:hypothetical protein
VATPLERILIDDARAVLRHAWSVRLSTLSAALSACSALSDVLPYLGGVLPPKAMAAAAALSAVGAVGARLVPQRKLQEARDGR